MKQNVRISLIGDSEVGKTSLVKSWLLPNHTITKEHVPTRLEKYTACISQRGIEVALEIWDIGGSFKDEALKVFQQTDCFILCFNLVSRKSLESIENKWVPTIQQHRQNANIILVGCKTDLRESVKTQEGEIASYITTDQGFEIAKKISAIAYKECSSLKKSSVKEIFDESISAVTNQSYGGNKRGSLEQQQQQLQHQQQNQIQLESLLKKDGLKFEELLQDEVRMEFLKEFRMRNKSVISYLSRKDVIAHLLSFFSNVDKTQQEQFNACELLTADVPAIIDSFCSDKQLWGELFKFFITTKPPAPRVTPVNYLIRVINFMISRANIEFMTYLHDNKDTIAYIIDHIGSTESIISLLVSIVDCEVTLSNAGIDTFVSNEIIPLFAQKIANSSSLTESDINGICDFIETITKKYPKIPMIQKFHDKLFIDQLIRNSFYDISDKSELYLILLIKLIQISSNIDDYMSKKLPPLLRLIIQEDEDDTNEESEASSTNTTTTTPLQPPPLEKLYLLLYQRAGPLGPSVTTTAGMVSPLGFQRLKYVELVLTLVKSNYHLVDTALMEAKIIGRSIDLFFQYKWNNVLHSIVVQLTSHILETKPPYICLYLLRDCHLVDRILQAVQNEEQERSLKMKVESGSPWQPLVGYMGHLYVLANRIVQSSKVHSAVYYLLEDVPNRTWKKFVDGKLKQVNQAQAPPPDLPRPERKGNTWNPKA